MVKGFAALCKPEEIEEKTKELAKEVAGGKRAPPEVRLRRLRERLGKAEADYEESAEVVRIALGKMDAAEERKKKITEEIEATRIELAGSAATVVDHAAMKELEKMKLVTGVLESMLMEGMQSGRDPATLLQEVAQVFVDRDTQENGGLNVDGEGVVGSTDPYESVDLEGGSFSREVRRRLRGKGPHRHYVLKEENGDFEEVGKQDASMEGDPAGGVRQEESNQPAPERMGDDPAVARYQQTDLFKYFKNCERMDGVRAARGARQRPEPY